MGKKKRLSRTSLEVKTLENREVEWGLVSVTSISQEVVSVGGRKWPQRRAKDS